MPITPVGRPVTSEHLCWEFAVVAAPDEVAHAHGSTPPHEAHAWLLVRHGIPAPLASATDDKQLADLVEATKPKLNADSNQKLNEVSVRKLAAGQWLGKEGQAVHRKIGPISRCGTQICYGAALGPRPIAPTRLSGMAATHRQHRVEPRPATKD